MPYSYVEGRDNFDIDMDMIEKRITPKTKLLILNDLQIVNQNSISIAEIKLADLNSQLIIDEKGKLKYINELQETFSNMPSNDKAEKPSKESEI